MLIGTKIKQETVKICSKEIKCKDCRCSEEECIDNLYATIVEKLEQN